MRKDIILSTGDVKEEYKIVGIISASQVIRSWWVKTGAREINKFTPKLMEKLKVVARRKRCDAVINIDYEFTRGEKDQEAWLTGRKGRRTTAIMTATGTGVKFL